MSLRNTVLFMSLSVAGACVGDLEDEVTTDHTQSSLTTWRTDQTAELLAGEGSWGDWTQPLYCNEGMYATGYRMRVEPSQGAGRTPDDTALNAVELHCASTDFSRSEALLPHPGLWGDWGAYEHCPSSGFLRGAHMRIEGSRGRGEDDTAANDVEFTCTNGGYAQATNGTGWGDWNAWQSCAEGSAVCGISVRFEKSQGGGRRDDTALNGISLKCCQL